MWANVGVFDGFKCKPESLKSNSIAAVFLDRKNPANLKIYLNCLHED